MDVPMPTATGEIHVFTFKEGVLSRVAHDLRLSLERFRVTIDADALSATFETASLRVDGIIRKGELDRDELDAAQRQEIEHTIRTRILDTRTYPLARLEARTARVGPVLEVRGELELLGQRRGVTFSARAEGGDGGARREGLAAREFARGRLRAGARDEARAGRGLAQALGPVRRKKYAATQSDAVRARVTSASKVRMEGVS
jgi:polyisoprenoid-binding protein YceI